MPRLVACSSCSTHVRADESTCPHCGSPMRSGSGVIRTAGAVLMGLSLTACPADDDDEDTGASSATMTAGSTSTDPGSTSDPGSTTDIDPTTSGPEPAYGVGTTDFPSTSSSSGGTGTDGTDGTSSSSGGSESSSTSLGGPEYGVPETSGE